ncbi:nicotianamine synthase family protein [Fictibacillus iocasae]|uniref:Nicotianamine synthase family protein n=1 Tax=Fictibacillus iocasae TaxID=2715437 RepID=A0ABW2NVF5_9BACL
MKERFELLLSLKTLEYEINELLNFSRECEECYELLQNKLDSLHAFMTCEKNVNSWDKWGLDEVILTSSERVREASVRALCDMEKHQSTRTCHHQLSGSEYIQTLSESVKKELDDYGINELSNVLFIGSGAFPISALTIASEKGASVCCLDIDAEAVALGRKLAEWTGLESKVAFTDQKPERVTFTKGATHIFIASLVEDKQGVLRSLQDTVHHQAKIILRYGNGLKSIFNYPVDPHRLTDWSVINTHHGEGIYDTIVLEKKIHNATT